jgi:hypothetical protein
MVSLLPILGPAKPLSQQIYEEQVQRNCGEASLKEVVVLNTKCIGPSTSSLNLQDLDNTAEHLVFSNIAKSESDRLTCLIAQYKQILEKPEINAYVLNQTCDRLARLKDAIRNIEFINSKLKTYRTASDRSLRIVPEVLFQKYQKIIHELEVYLLLYEKLEASLRFKDVLLSSPRIFKNIESKLSAGLLTDGESPETVCAELSSNMKDLLAEDITDIEKSKSLIDKNLRSNNFADEDFKRGLWGSPSRGDFLTQFSKNPELQNSAFCRLEGRYGRGAVSRDSLANIATLALGFGAGQIGKLAVFATSAKRADVALLATRTALGVDIGIGSAIGANEVIHSCKEKLRAFSARDSCATQNESQRKDLFYRQSASNQCLLSASIGVVSAGLAGLGLRNTLNRISKNEIGSEISEHVFTTQRLIAPHKESSVLKVARVDNVPKGAITNQVLEDFKRKFGFAPMIESKIDDELGNTISLFHPTSKERIGFLEWSYHADLKQIELDLTKIAPEYQEAGLSNLLTEQMVKQAPEANEIFVSALILDNNWVVQKYLDRGYSLKDAIKESPAYKNLSKSGFTEITKIYEKSNGFKVSRPHP